MDGNTVFISSTFNGISLSKSDSVTPFTTFDHLAIFFGSQFGNVAVPRSNFVDDVSVTYTSAIPEPSAYAALAGVAGLSSAALRRRRS